MSLLLFRQEKKSNRHVWTDNEWNHNEIKQKQILYLFWNWNEFLSFWVSTKDIKAPINHHNLIVPSYQPVTNLCEFNKSTDGNWNGNGKDHPKKNPINSLPSHFGFEVVQRTNGACQRWSRW